METKFVCLTQLTRLQDTASLFSLLLSRPTLTIRSWDLSLFKVRRLMQSLRRCPFWSRGTKNGTLPVSWLTIHGWLFAVIKGSVQLLLLFSKGYRSSCSMQSTMMQQISTSFSHVRIYNYANDIRLQVKWPEGKCKMCSNSSRGTYLTYTYISLLWNWKRTTAGTTPANNKKTNFPPVSRLCLLFGEIQSSITDLSISGSVWQPPFEGLQSDVALF